MRVLSPDACGATPRHQRIHACAECHGARVLKRPQGTRALQYIYIIISTVWFYWIVKKSVHFRLIRFPVVKMQY